VYREDQILCNGKTVGLPVAMATYLERENYHAWRFNPMARVYKPILKELKNMNLF
jgi:hypothetical protein